MTGKGWTSSLRVGLPRTLAVCVGVFSLLLGASPAHAHCDGLDGPVVAAAREALRTGDVNLVLVWVKSGADEEEIRRALRHALDVRKLGERARDLADTFFFETLVRVHRAGEGAPYTGLKPAGRDLGQAIPAADKALADGNVDAVVKLVTNATAEGIHNRFNEATRLRGFPKEDLTAGREYVEAYVAYIHYVEGVFQAAARSPHGHFAEADDAPAIGGHLDREASGR